MKYLLACFCTFSPQLCHVENVFFMLSVTTLTEGGPCVAPGLDVSCRGGFVTLSPSAAVPQSGWENRRSAQWSWAEGSSDNRRIPGTEGWHHCFSGGGGGDPVAGRLCPSAVTPAAAEVRIPPPRCACFALPQPRDEPAATKTLPVRLWAARTSAAALTEK